MSFVADKQTLDDLNLLGKYKPDSVYSLFNKVRTRGAEKLLDEMFRCPLSDPEQINQRSAVFLYMQGKAPIFPFSGEQLMEVEDYLSEGSPRNIIVTAVDTFRKMLLETTTKDEGYKTIQKGLGVMVAFLQSCRDFIGGFDELGVPKPLLQHIHAVKHILDDKRLAGLPQKLETADYTWMTLTEVHYLFGHILQEEMNRLCGILYYFDLCIAVGKVAKERKFSYAWALPEEEYTILAADLRHPCLEKAVGNPVSLDGRKNLLFLTGANMAGKSTFMKSFGIAVYLAHMGFPVAANEMVFSVKDGLYSSINVPDNLSLGYSHFYAEVHRVKTIAEAVSQSKSLVIIFDELFKGTNVKDAFDATAAVTVAFSEYRNCCFIISTHIIEVAEVLREQCDNIQFFRLPTVMEGSKPRYTYSLEEGVASDRHGMMIIENEGVLDLITSVKNESTSEK